MTRHLVSLTSLGRDGLIALLDRADLYRDTRGTPAAPRPLVGKSVALVFEKPSTRTRVSLEVAVVELGGYPCVITSTGSQIARGEPVRDTARVLSRMCHAITLRTGAEERLLEMVAHSRVPVLNALTDESHPMQLLADLQTVRKVHGRLQGLRFAWIGDGNNMAASWIEAAGLLGLDLVLACPDGYRPNERLLNEAKARGAKLEVVGDPRVAAQGAHVISTDVFTSMGQETEQAARLKAFAGMRVSTELVALASPDVAVLHCLPAHRGEEIDEEVLEGPRSVVWDQSEARLHTAKASLEWALEVDG